MHDFLFVLEQTLGHVAHGRNLERVLATEDDVRATCLHVEYEPSGWQRLPVLGNWSLRASWSARRWLDRNIAESSPHAIFIHTQSAALLATAVMRRVPTVVSVDATPANFDQVGAAYAHRASGSVIEAAKRTVHRRAFSAAAGVVSWCDWAARSLENDYGVPGRKVRVIPPGVDLNLFRPADRSPSDAVRLLFVGGDLERKGGTDLLAALPLLRHDARLDLVTGSAVSSPPPGVQVHQGLKPQSPELIRLFREADVFVLPTRGDCLPQVLAEAMACGLPVVATAVGAVPEVVRDGVNGLIVPTASPRDIAAALDTLIANPDRRRSMGRSGLELARRDHDMARNNRAILDYMRELAVSPSPRAVVAA